MNISTIKSAALALALCACSFNSSLAFAQPFHGGRGEHGGPPQERGERMMEHMTEMLDLTDDQEAKVKEIRTKYETELKTNFEAVRAARDDIRTAVHADTFSEADIRKASKVLASAEEEAAVVRGKMASEIRALLTDEQKAKQSKVMNRFRERNKR